MAKSAIVGALALIRKSRGMADRLTVLLHSGRQEPLHNRDILSVFVNAQTLC